MKLRDTPIQAKLIRVILLTTGTSLFLACAAFLTYEFFVFRQDTKSQLLTVGHIVAANSTAALAFDNRQDAIEILNALKTERHIVAACLYDKGGKIFATYIAKPMGPGFPAKPGDDGGYMFENGYVEGFEAVTEGSNRLGTLYLRSDMGAIYTRLQLYGMITLLVLGASFLVAYLLSRSLQRSISQPILNLAETARLVSEKYDYSVRAVKSGDDELGLLTDAFNHMLTQIELQNLEILLFNQKLEQKVIERTNELRSANKELQMQNEFVETILDSSVHLVAVLDTETRFTTVNNQFCLVYHKTKSDVIGKKYEEAFPVAKDSQTHQDILRALQGEYIYNQVVKSRLVDAYFENYFIPLKENDHIYGVLVLGHDITNIMEANEKLKLLNEQLVKSNLDLEQFAYVASHDLQEPLRKIQTFAQLARKDLENASAPANYLEKITASAKRMAELINAVLNYSRLSKNREQFVQTDLNGILNNIKTDLELLISEKNASITSDPLPVIEGIPLQLSQLFFNLIGNSLKFSEKAPAIHISARIMRGSEIKRQQVPEKNEDYLELVFSDNGVGFEQQYAERIFTIFQRLHDKQSYTGTGIGLALCKKIVENHNGYISAESRLGEGAAFYIYLPVHHIPGIHD
ncbi:MAG: PAS domain-containing protein [Chitinophagaceae bacterium]|nr:PAS domain-containing protein [Chitinophagaceae bacterium]